MWIDRIQEFNNFNNYQFKNNGRILELKNVTKRFSKTSGIKNISFKIREGEFVAFIGDNGVGKTTTIKCLLGDYLLDEGSITLENEKLHQPKIMRDIAFFPDQNNFPKNTKIVDYAYYCANLKGVRKSVLKKRIQDYLLALDLKDSAHKKFSELSSGMQKRALLLSTLVTSPKIIILDEPTANLDIKTRIEFMNLLAYLNQSFQTTIIITSHNIDELNHFINRVILLKKDGGFGSVVYDKRFDNQHENLKDIYLEVIGEETKSIDYLQIKEILKNEGW